MLYKLNNTGLLSDFYIPEYEKSILFNYCKLNFNQYHKLILMNDSCCYYQLIINVIILLNL